MDMNKIDHDFEGLDRKKLKCPHCEKCINFDQAEELGEVEDVDGDGSFVELTCEECEAEFKIEVEMYAVVEITYMTTLTKDPNTIIDVEGQSFMDFLEDVRTD